MKKIAVTSERSYEVEIGRSYLEALIEIAQGRERVAVIYSEAMKEQIPTFDFGGAEAFYFGIADGEAGKSARTLESIWNWLGAAGFTRSDLIIGIGGGAVTDLAGYAAASWLRGLDWVAIPTTVAGMVDAAVGGKTGINSDYGKNLIGAFHSPIKVIADTAWLETLSDRDFVAGLAEVVKCGFIADGQILTMVEGLTLNLIRSSKELTQELIERAVQVKADVVSGDFKESFNREILNYGHTFGHALEADTGFSDRLFHGEAVAAGMALAFRYSVRLGLCAAEDAQRVSQLLKAAGLPTTLSDAGVTANGALLVDYMRHDKKMSGGTLPFLLARGIGQTFLSKDVVLDDVAAFLDDEAQS
mgnify:CR=1 FL=1